MSHTLFSRTSAILSAGRVCLAPALAALALAACGPDAGPTSASDAASAAPSAASAAAAARAGLEPVAPTPSTAGPALPSNLAAAPACPKLVEPQCPAAPANLAARSAHQSVAASASGAAREAWRHSHRTHLGMARKHRHWSGRPVHDEPIAHEHDERAGLTERSERFAGGYRMEEGEREISRSTYSRGYEGDRVVARDSVRGGPRCLTLCPGPHAGPRRFDSAGIDARGYLVWPGKVEY